MRSAHFLGLLWRLARSALTAERKEALESSAGLEKKRGFRQYRTQDQDSDDTRLHNVTPPAMYETNRLQAYRRLLYDLSIHGAMLFNLIILMA